MDEQLLDTDYEKNSCYNPNIWHHKSQVHDLEANSNVLKKGALPIGPIISPEELDQTKKIVDIQKSEIKRLRDELRHSINRPLSNGQRLPPLEVAQWIVWLICQFKLFVFEVVTLDKV